MRDAKATPRGGFVLSERAVRSAQLELGAARTAARAKLARGRSSSQACARALLRRAWCGTIRRRVRRRDDAFHVESRGGVGVHCFAHLAVIALH